MLKKIFSSLRLLIETSAEKPPGKIVNIHYSTFASGIFLFLLMLLVPASYQSTKAILLLIVLGSIAWGFLTKTIDIKLHETIRIWVAILVLTGLLFITLGWLNNAPGALRVSTVYIIWPIVFSVLISAILTFRALKTIVSTMVIAGVFLGLYGAMYIAHSTGLWPDALYFHLDQGQAIGFYDGFVEYNMYSISVLIILTPILGALIVVCDKSLSLIAKGWLSLAYALCFGLSILSGRRALWVVLLLAPIIFFTLAIWQRLDAEERRNRIKNATLLSAISAVVLFVLTGMFGLSSERMLAYLISSVPLEPASALEESASALEESASTLEESASVRYLQAVALWDGWMTNPWFGHGHGSVAGVIRSSEMPWAYELTYLALLFHTGVIGVLLYGACIGWIYWQGILVIRKSNTYGSYMVAVLTGATCFLIANMTNPYLAKFDFMWIVFLPLAIINLHLLEKDKNEAYS